MEYDVSKHKRFITDEFAEIKLDVTFVDMNDIVLSIFCMRFSPAFTQMMVKFARYFTVDNSYRI